MSSTCILYIVPFSILVPFKYALFAQPGILTYNENYFYVLTIILILSSNGYFVSICIYEFLLPPISSGIFAINGAYDPIAKP